MKFLALTVVVASAYLLPACSSNNQPTAPAKSRASTVAGSDSPFTVAGTVTERRGGPLTGVSVTARLNRVPPDQNEGKVLTTTNGAGQYRVAGLTQATIFDFAKDGYDGVGNAGAFTTSTTLDVVLDRTLKVDVGRSLSATIWGDDDYWDEDLLSTCHTPQVCRFVHLIAPAPGTVTAELRTINPAYRVGFLIHMSGPGTFTSAATEIPGSGGVLAASANLPYPGDNYGIIVQLYGAGRKDHQDFQLRTEFRPQ